MRQIFLDTETTGMNQVGTYYEGHKIIEIGAIETINHYPTNNNFHVYLNPGRLVDADAINVHGITNSFLIDKPIFSEIADEFINYISGAELIIHNAPFDIDFINYEISNLNRNLPKINTFCKVTDSLELARKIFPGKRNSLDALCLRYGIDNSKRNVHGALVDAKILSSIYLAMISVQTSIPLNIEVNNEKKNNIDNTNNIKCHKNKIRVILANKQELVEHESYLDKIQKVNGICIWRL